MKKPNTSTMTPDEMRKQAAALFEQATREEAALAQAERPQLIAKLTKKYAGTAWLHSSQTPPVKRMWLVKIKGFYQDKGSFCINYRYETLILTLDKSREICVAVLPNGAAGWYNTTESSLQTPMPVAVFDKYIRAARSLPSEAFKTLRQLAPKYFTPAKKPAKKLFPKVKKPR